MTEAPDPLDKHRANLPPGLAECVDRCLEKNPADRWQSADEMLPLLQGKIDVQVRDIDTNEAWQNAYDVRIPVVEYEGQVLCEAHLDKAKIEAIVAASVTPEES